MGYNYQYNEPIMETKFNLSKEIQNYLEKANQKQSITNSDAQEIKAHFYDSCNNLTRGGLSEEEAFIIAKKRIGNEETLATEYSKVNPSIVTNRIWAYLILGFSFFQFLPQLYIILLKIVYSVGNSDILEEHVLLKQILIICVNLFTVFFVFKLLKLKEKIATYIENLSIRTALFAGVFSIGISMILHLLSRRIEILNTDIIAEIHSKAFENSLVQFSFYLMILSVIMGVLILIFSINKIEKLRIKNVFEKPSLWFVLIFGILIEILAASSRIFRSEEGFETALAFACFAMIYYPGAYLLTKFNVYNSAKLLLIYGAFGITVELFFGLNADIGRGSFYTPIFVSGMLSGIFLGRYVALIRAKKMAISR